MSARDLERLDHVADDFADDHELRGEAGTSEQDTPVAKTPSHRGMTGTPEAPTADDSAAGALATRPTSGAGEPPERARVAARVAQDERRVRAQTLAGTRGRVSSSSTIDPPRELQSPGDLWALAIQHLERAAVCLKTSAHRTDNIAAATAGHREVEQLQMMLERVRPEQHAVDTHGTRRGVA